MGGWKMAETRHEGGVSYHIPGKDYFEQRELRRHAGVFALWALGVGAVISGDFSGWNLGFAVGGWGGLITGVAENIEYVLTPAVIVFFIGSYLTGIFETPAAFQPVWWILGYIVFVGLN